MNASGERHVTGSKRPGTVALAFHEATKHSIESVRQRGHYLRWENKPNPFKVIPGVERVELPGDVVPTGVPVLEAVRGVPAPVTRRAPSFAEVARLLLVGAGLRRRVVYADGEEFFFRTYASAGALYPIEIYLLPSSLDGLEAGVYHFDPAGRALVPLRHGDHRGYLSRAAGDEPAVAETSVTIVLTGIPWRTTWKYTERGYRHLFWDGGMILANLLALASAAAMPAKVALGFVDDEVEALLGLERDREFPLCMLTVGSDGAVEPAASPPEPLTYPFPPLSPREMAYSAIAEVNDAGRLPTPEVVQEWRALPQPDRGVGAQEVGETSIRPAPAPPPADSIEVVISRRGSARRFRRTSMPRAVLTSILEAATGDIPNDLDSQRLSTVYLVANAVDGLEPGAYFYRSGSFGLLRQGDFRDQAAFLCLEQRLGGDAAVTLFLLADLEGVLGVWGDRGYRVAQLEAGIVAARIYLGAYGYGYGASGLTFYDDEVTSFFSPHAAGKSCMLVAAVGESLGRPDLRPRR